MRLLADAARIDHPVPHLMRLEDEPFDRTGCLALFDALGSADERPHASPGRHPEVPTEEGDATVAVVTARLRDDVPRRITSRLAE